MSYRQPLLRNVLRLPSKLPFVPKKNQDGNLVFGNHLKSCNALYDRKIIPRFLYVMPFLGLQLVL